MTAKPPPRYQMARPGALRLIFVLATMCCGSGAVVLGLGVDAVRVRPLPAWTPSPTPVRLPTEPFSVITADGACPASACLLGRTRPSEASTSSQRLSSHQPWTVEPRRADDRDIFRHAMLQRSLRFGVVASQTTPPESSRKFVSSDSADPVWTPSQAADE